MREEVLESFSQLAPESLCKLTESVIGRARDSPVPNEKKDDYTG